MRFVEIENYLVETKNEIAIFKNTLDELHVESNLDNEKSDLLVTIDLSNKKKKRKINDEKLMKSIQEKVKQAGLNEYFLVELNTLKQNLGAYTGTEFNNFHSALNSIVSKIDLLFHVESLSKPSQENYDYIYAIKLPKYEYFDDVAEFTKQLNFIFSTVMPDNRKVKLVGFDKGSEWYQVALENLVEFKLMALFISEVTKWVRFVIEDKRRENEITVEDDARRMILENMETNQMMIKDYAVKKVLSENGNAESNEEYVKCQKAFERMAELIMKGTKVEIDKQQTLEDSSQNESPLELPKLEDIQKLLEMYSDSLIEHNPDEE